MSIRKIDKEELIKIVGGFEIPLDPSPLVYVLASVGPTGVTPAHIELPNGDDLTNPHAISGILRGLF